ncbi:MAG: alpha-ketoglutarate-dependent dioxygenase AlkB family protein [Flavobacteriaceae bacterium]
MQELFAPQGAPWKPELPDAELLYYPNFWDVQTAQTLFEELYNQTPWQHDPITVFGKTYMQPRLTALYGENTQPYSYSGIVMHPHPMTVTLKNILSSLQTADSHPYNTVLLNLYRDGRDSNGWHADDEKELGPNPRIASVSLGEERYFHFKHRTKKSERYKLLLKAGSLLIMGGTMQKYWVHQIAKTARPKEPRINLTFRKLI